MFLKTGIRSWLVSIWMMSPIELWQVQSLCRQIMFQTMARNIVQVLLETGNYEKSHSCLVLDMALGVLGVAFSPKKASQTPAGIKAKGLVDEDQRPELLVGAVTVQIATAPTKRKSAGQGAAWRPEMPKHLRSELRAYSAHQVDHFNFLHGKCSVTLDSRWGYYQRKFRGRNFRVTDF